MTIDDKIRIEKLQYDINREAAKISALSSGKIDKYEYFTDEINQNDLIYYFKGDTARKRFHDFNNGIELFKKYILMK